MQKRRCDNGQVFCVEAIAFYESIWTVAVGLSNKELALLILTATASEHLLRLRGILYSSMLILQRPYRGQTDCRELSQVSGVPGQNIGVSYIYGQKHHVCPVMSRNLVRSSRERLAYSQVAGQYE